MKERYKTMSENQKRILQLVAEGKITVEEGARLLSLMDKEPGNGIRESAKVGNRPIPKYLYIKVEPKEGAKCKTDINGHRTEPGRVNIRIPVGLIRAGMKLTALIPPQVADDINKAMKEKGIGFDIRNMKEEYVDEFIAALGDTEIDVDSEEAEVKVHAE
jgi:hypothetical protein